MALDYEYMVTAGIMGLMNLGGVALLVRKYMGSVDEHNKILPPVIETLNTLNVTLAKTNKAIEELYESRNSHSVAIEEIKTTHRLRGCNQPVHLHNRGADEN